MKTHIIKIEMIKQNKTNIELANELNINVNTISRWLNCKNLKQIESFLKMLSILDIDYKSLIE